MILIYNFDYDKQKFKNLNETINNVITNEANSLKWNGNKQEINSISDVINSNSEFLLNLKQNFEQISNEMIQAHNE